MCISVVVVVVLSLCCFEASSVVDLRLPGTNI